MLNEIKYIWAVYQERSFTKAAKKLFISQPALSSMVKKVEQEIGVPIFDRSTIPLSLTPDGEYYIESIKKIMTIERNIHTYFEDIQQLETGSLTIGGSSFFCSFTLPELMGTFSRKYPKVTINIVEGNLLELRKQLEDETIDLIIETAVQEDDPSLDTFLFTEEMLILAVPASMPINNQLTKYQCSYEQLCRPESAAAIPAVPLKYFSDSPFVMLKKENDLGRRAVSMCEEAGFVPKGVMYTDQLLTALNISTTGIGINFTRLDLFRYIPMKDSFCLYRLDSPLAHRKIFFAAKKGRYLRSTSREFLKMMEKRRDSGRRAIKGE